MKTLSEFDRHLILYTKYRYVRTDNKINDLKRLFGGIAEIDPEYYKHDDIWAFVVDVFTKFVEQPEQCDCLKRLFRPFGTFKFNDLANFEDTLDSFLGAIGNIMVKDNPLLPDGLGYPDATLLPVSENAKARLDKLAE